MDPLKAEFIKIAEAIEGSRDRFHGRQQLKDYGEELDTLADGSDPVRAAALHGQLAFEFLRLGYLERSRAHLEAVFSLAQTYQLPPSELMLRLRVLVDLRSAEMANCIGQPHRECCLFPLNGGGRHTVAEPALRAQEGLTEIIKMNPTSLDAWWLLNLMAMATGDYPDKVPPSIQVPPPALQSAQGFPRFHDIARDLGIDDFNLCGGVVTEDFDGDGYLDIATSTSALRGHLLLHRNRGDGTFEEVSKTAGLQSQLGGLNLIGADYDNDGDTDLLVLRGGWMGEKGRIRNSLLRNETPADASSPIRFRDVTREAGLADPAYPTQAAVWADFDQDGHLDLFVGNESPGERAPHAEAYPSQLYRNRGDGTFIDVAAEAGVQNRRLTKGVTTGDFDNDGDMDLYVSNIGANRLYRNLRKPDEGNVFPVFEDVAPQLGVTHPNERSFAPWFFDYDNDGWLDLFVPAYDATTADLMRDYLGRPHRATAPCLYRNQGGTFVNVAKEQGLDHPYLPMGASFGDVDNDGWLDIYLATGDPSFETLMPNVMLRNDIGKGFLNITTEGGFGHLQKGHGISFADFDHDGDQDLFHQLGGFYPGDGFRNAFYLNPGTPNHHLSLELIGRMSNRDAIGARIAVKVTTPDGPRTFHRAIGSVSSFGGSPIRRQEIGLGAAISIGSVTVRWPGSGREEVHKGIPLDGLIQLTEGENTFKTIPRARLTFPTPR